ncbi:MAG TPA: AIPR family protein [Gammaproteobacteria bacterium]|nr:AIPR family protein [Gammaproteobacteria bacterium]
MKNDSKQRLLRFLYERLSEIRERDKFKTNTLGLSHAFISWFVETHYSNPTNLILSDGSYDGKIDGWTTVSRAGKIKYIVINSKYSKNGAGKISPQFYEEIETFSYPFRIGDPDEREDYLITHRVKEELRPRYRELYKAYDQGNAELVFITTYQRNTNKTAARRYKDVNIFDQLDLLQTLTDDIDGASPESAPLTLSELPGSLSVPSGDTDVPCVVTFPRVQEIVKQAKEDHFDLLFARNVRVSIDPKRSFINRSIVDTYQKDPKAFAISNNGITILADNIEYRGKKKLKLINPRIVNGSQTVNSLKEVRPNPQARVLTKIIKVGNSNHDALAIWSLKSQTANQIARRTNEQNPIKKWDLVANDNFQLKLFRLFRSRGIYYDRRVGEYAKKGRQRRALVKGPSIRQLTQLIASYHYKNKKLGPAAAKVSVSKLFDRKPYELIEKTAPEVAYQLCLLWVIMQRVSRGIPSYSKLGQIAKHGNLMTSTIICRALKNTDYNLGVQRTRRLLEVVLDDTAWQESQKRWIRLIRSGFKASQKLFIAARGKYGRLTENNYFKSNKYIQKSLRKAIPKAVNAACRNL